MAVDGNGNAISGGQDTAWPAPVAVDRRGGGLTGVSCPPAASCVAVDFGGRALALPS
jgi:hypothetical protein